VNIHSRVKRGYAEEATICALSSSDTGSNLRHDFSCRKKYPRERYASLNAFFRVKTKNHLVKKEEKVETR
jgi:hypothetical protein